MASNILHPLLRFKQEIDQRFGKNKEEGLYEVFGGKDRLGAFQDLLRIALHDYGKDIMINIDWSEDELSKLKEIKRSRQF